MKIELLIAVTFGIPITGWVPLDYLGPQNFFGTPGTYIGPPGLSANPGIYEMYTCRQTDRLTKCFYGLHFAAKNRQFTGVQRYMTNSHSRKVKTCE